jgi:hypothetical protein
MSDEDSPEQPREAGPRDAKAEAAAAKAYAKAQRPWYKKKRWIFSIGVVLLIIVIAAAGSGGSGDNGSEPSGGTTSEQTPTATEETAADESTETPTLAPASGGPTADLPISDGDWRLDSIRVKDDGLGDFGGTGRVTYTGDSPEGGTNLFTVTVFVKGKDVAALEGSADEVEPGTAATVQFISSDKFVKGPYKYDFQKEL